MSLRQPLEVYNRIEVSRGAILHNFDLLQHLVPNGYVFPVLKANAYGHGLAQVATILKDRSFPYLAVDGYYEALTIRKFSRQPILVMGAIPPANFRRFRLKNIAFAVHDKATIQAIGQTGRRTKIHLEIDSGMNRHGIKPNELANYLDLIKQYSKLELEGLMTHLADADNPVNDFTSQQVKVFDKAAEQALAAGFRPKYFHIGNSAGSAKVKSAYANAIRPGICLYGISPLEAGDNHAQALKDLKPALTLSSAITKVINLEKGGTVSYGRTFAAQKSTKIGVLPLGYYEALPRSLSNNFQVMYGRKYLPQVGRICMNHTMINLNQSNAKVGDRVVLISANPASQNSIANICQKHGLFSYELLVKLNSSIRRNVAA